MFRTVLATVALVLVTSAAEPYCDAPSEVQAELRRAAQLWDYPMTRAGMSASRKGILEALVARYPDDIQANRRYQNDLDHKKQDLIATYKARLEARPDDALSTYFYALTLIRQDTPQAIRLLEGALKRDPSLAWAHLGLAYIYGWGNFADKAKATEHIDKFFGLCPTASDSYAVRTLGSQGSPEVQKQVARQLRERLSSETNPERLGVWESLWDLEFKVTPPAAHSELRKQILADVKRIRGIAGTPTIAALRTVRNGLKQAGDQSGLTAAETETAALFPKSRDAAEITRQRWHKEHPYPKPSDGEVKKREWALLLYPEAARWLEQWPLDPLPRSERFNAARALQDLPPVEMKAAADGLVRFLRDNELMYAFPPFPHQAAEEYLKRDIFPEEVVALAEEGLRGVQKREGGREPDDMAPPDIAKYSQSALRSAEIGTVDLLARAYLKLKKPDQATALQTRLEAVQPGDEREKVDMMRAMSRVAELAGRRADAFAYLEQAVEISPKPTNDFAKEQQTKLRADLRRLWTELGGTEQTWKLRTDEKPQVSEAKPSGEWKAPEKAIPAFTLADLSGKTWTTDSFAGKTVLINVWASWCGPCRAEHPKLQKLYESLKDRKDIAVLSFNVDDQVGLVQPYLDEGKYTFPVLLAGRFVKDLFDGISIPRNWLIDGEGSHRLEQIGYAESSDWAERMTAAMEKLAAEPKQAR